MGTEGLNDLSSCNVCSLFMLVKHPDKVWPKKNYNYTLYINTIYFAYTYTVYIIYTECSRYIGVAFFSKTAFEKTRQRENF